MKIRDATYEHARRQENAAHNELDYYERQALRQKLQLDGMFKYKKECVNALKMAKETGLTPLHVREFQLLMSHINSIIETTSYKVDISQDQYEKAKEIWQDKNEHFEIVKASIKKNANEEVNSGVNDSEKAKKSGYYHNDGITMIEKSNRGKL